MNGARARPLSSDVTGRNGDVFGAGSFMTMEKRRVSFVKYAVGKYGSINYVSWLERHMRALCHNLTL